MDIHKRLENFKWIVGDCWRFLGATTSKSGHGQIFYKGKMVYVNRLSMHLYKGFDLKSTSQINHKLECKYPDCWNPEHLYEGDQDDNMKDKSIKTTHCPYGHEYVASNITYNSRGGKQCRACSRINYKKKISLRKKINNGKQTTHA